MKRSEVERQQEGILAPDGPLYSSPTIIHTPHNLGILREITEYDEEVIRWALGDFGMRLRDFARAVDLTHPEITNTIFLEPEFSDKFCQVLKLVQYARQQGMVDCLDGLSKLYTKNLPQQMRFLDSPFKNQQYVRLLPSRQEREQVRSTKSMREIDLRSFHKKGLIAWDGLPSDFGLYVRHNESYKDQLVVAEKRAEKYRSLGLVEMAGRITESIENFREMMEENYYGFHRITMTNAAVIAAKMHGYKFLTPGEEFDGWEVTTFKIAVPSRNFKKYQFEIGNPNRKSYWYCPRAYPLNEMPQIPKKVKSIIEELERFKDVNEKAIFDHYAIVVPSVKFPDDRMSATNEDLISIMDRHGEVKQFDNYQDADKEVDTNLIRKKLVTPVLLGEKDGRCYFICYWV